MTKKILLIEDEESLHDVIKAYLEKEGFQTISIFSGKDALDVISKEISDYQAVVLDIMLPEISGLELLKEIRKKSDIPVIMLTALGDEVDKLLGLELGADDYVVKPFSPRELVARIKAVVRRFERSALADKEARLVRGPFVFDKESMQVFYIDKPIPLTASEIKIVFKIAENPKRVFSRNELLELIASEYEVDERVIDAHIKNIRRKLEDAGAIDFIETVRGFGYSFKRNLMTE
jgi:DNA-binding response OmpR family regulator